MFGGDYEKQFDPGVYLASYYNIHGTVEDGDILPIVLKFIHDQFQRPCHDSGGSLLDFGTGPSIHTVLSASRTYSNITLSDYAVRLCHESGGSLLDFGSGPSIHAVLSASRTYSDITLSDYARVNREQLHKWVAKAEGAHDWQAVIAHVAELESNSAAAIESRLRAAITDILPCDVLIPNPLHPVVRTYDCIISSLCLECCVNTQQGYVHAVRNVASLLKPGGSLIMLGVLGQTEYLVNEVPFGTMKLSVAGIEAALTEAGLTELEIIQVPFGKISEEDQKYAAVSDFEGTFMLHCSKK